MPTAQFAVFNSADEAESYINGREETLVVVKADGLAAGKGVVVCAKKKRPSTLMRIMREANSAMPVAAWSLKNVSTGWK